MEILYVNIPIPNHPFIPFKVRAEFLSGRLLGETALVKGYPVLLEAVANIQIFCPDERERQARALG